MFLVFQMDRGQPNSDVHRRHKPHKKIDVMEDIDSVPSNVQSARQEALLYVFEDNEAVIKMIIKSRSPTMRLSADQEPTPECLKKSSSPSWSSSSLWSAHLATN